jgi:hypothetical protein
VKVQFVFERFDRFLLLQKQADRNIGYSGMPEYQER